VPMNDEFANDGHRQEHMPWVVEKRNKPKLFVEPTSVVVDGINFDRANAELVCQLLGSSQYIDQEQGTKPLALYASVDCEPPEQHHRHINPRQALGLVIGQAPRRTIWLEIA
jgi:hypothetical protein